MIPESFVISPNKKEALALPETAPQIFQALAEKDRSYADWLRNAPWMLNLTNTQRNGHLLIIKIYQNKFPVTVVFDVFWGL